MKSIKQQYIDLKENKMSQANFMRNLRMTFPNLVTNVTSFDDSVKILRNKGILSEADVKKKILKESEMLYFWDGYKCFCKDDENNISPASIRDCKNEAINDMGDESPFKMDESSINENTAAEELAKEMGDYESAVIALEDKMGLPFHRAKAIALKIYGEEDEDAIIDAIKKYEEEEAGRYTTGEEQFPIEPINEAKAKWENTDGKAMYDQFKEIDNLNGQEVLIGIDAEMEKNHELSKKEAAKIVIKNLKKNPLYYTAEYMSGKEGYELEYSGGKSDQPEAQQMQSLDKNMGNVVDKKLGMKPVKDVEKVKKDSDTATAQKYKTSGISLMSLVAKTTRGVKKMDATGEKMKKVTIKEGQFTTNWDFSKDEQNKIKQYIDDAEFDVDRQEDTIKTTVTSKKHADKNIQHAVELVTLPPSSKVKPGIGDAIQNPLKEKSAEDRLAEQISQYIKETFDGMEPVPMSLKKLDETKLFADFNMGSDNNIESRFARSISETLHLLEYFGLKNKNITIDELFSEEAMDVIQDGDEFYAGPTESLRFFQTLPDEFTVTNNMDGVDESFKITKTGPDSFTAEEI